MLHQVYANNVFFCAKHGHILILLVDPMYIVTYLSAIGNWCFHDLIFSFLYPCFTYKDSDIYWEILQEILVMFLSLKVKTSLFIILYGYSLNKSSEQGFMLHTSGLSPFGHQTESRYSRIIFLPSYVLSKLSALFHLRSLLGNVTEA